MNIPDKAVDAAANAMVSASPDLSGWGDLDQAEIDWYMRDAREALEAAAPFIAADIREELCLVRAERDWMKEQLGRLHLDTLGEYADSLEDPQ